MARNSGKVFELPDGKIGIAYNKEQVHDEKLILRVFTSDFEPIMSEMLPNKQKTVFKLPSELKLIGFVD